MLPFNILRCVCYFQIGNYLQISNFHTDKQSNKSEKTNHAKTQAKMQHNNQPATTIHWWSTNFWSSNGALFLKQSIIQWSKVCHGLYCVVVLLIVVSFFCSHLLHYRQTRKNATRDEGGHESKVSFKFSSLFLLIQHN